MVLSPEILFEGTRNLILRDLKDETLNEFALGTPEIVESVGGDLLAQNVEGWYVSAIIHAVYADLFTSEDESIVEERIKLIKEFGGEEVVKYYPHTRTGEVIVLFKRSQQ